MKKDYGLPDLSLKQCQAVSNASTAVPMAARPQLGRMSIQPFGTLGVRTFMAIRMAANTLQTRLTDRGQTQSILAEFRPAGTTLAAAQWQQPDYLRGRIQTSSVKHPVVVSWLCKKGLSARANC